MPEAETETPTSEIRVTCTDIALPPADVSLDQDEEWCVVAVDGEWRKVRFHDYDRIYSIPGLYETLFYDVLKCSSPETVCGMLQQALCREHVDPADLHVLDLGAGNGMVGEQLARIGVRHMVGVDIIPEAAEAADRDRRGLYDDYLVVDMTDPAARATARLTDRELNCLTCVAALGFGDIPPAAFAGSFDLIAKGGWVAFNIKSDFVEAGSSGFARLIRGMIDDETITVRAERRYEHRVATCGEPLVYSAFVATKNRNLAAA